MRNFVSPRSHAAIRPIINAHNFPRDWLLSLCTAAQSRAHFPHFICFLDTRVRERISSTLRVCFCAAIKHYYLSTRAFRLTYVVRRTVYLLASHTKHIISRIQTVFSGWFVRSFFKWILFLISAQVFSFYFTSRWHHLYSSSTTSTPFSPSCGFQNAKILVCWYCYRPKKKYIKIKLQTHKIQHTRRKALTYHIHPMRPKNLKRRKRKKRTRAFTLMKSPKYVFLAKLVHWETVVYAKFVASKANGSVHCVQLMKKVYVACSCYPNTTEHRHTCAVKPHIQTQTRHSTQQTDNWTHTPTHLHTKYI